MKHPHGDSHQRAYTRLSSRTHRPLLLSLLAGTVVLLLIGLSLFTSAPLKEQAGRAEVERALASMGALFNAPRTLQVAVRDASTGALLPEVTYWIGQPGIEERTYATAQGRFTHVLPHGQGGVMCTIKAPGFGTQTRRLDIGNVWKPVVPVTFDMQPAAPLTGHVANEEAAAIAGAMVRISAWSSNRDIPGRMAYYSEVTSDAEGRWAVSDMPEDCDQVSLVLLHPDYVDDLMMRDAEVTPSRNIVSIMERGKPFGGRVISEAGEAIAGATLKIRHGEPVTTDADGHFLFPHCGEAYFSNETLEVMAPGHASRYIRLTTVDWHTGYEAVLRTGQPVAMRFLNASEQPLAQMDVFVSLSTESDNQVHYFNRETDDRGILTVPDAPEEVLWDVSVSNGSEEVYQPVRKLTLTPGQPLQTLHMALLPRVTLLVVDATTNEPLESFSVTPGYVYQEDGRRRSWWNRWFGKREPERIDWDHFSRQEASRLFRAYYDEYSGRPIRYRIESPSHLPAETRDFTADGANLTLKVALTPGMPLNVRVIDGDGAPVPHAGASWAPKDEALWIHVESDTPQRQFPAARSDVDGRLRMPPIARAKHALVIVADQGMAVLDAASLREGQDVVLPAWGRLEGELAPHIAAFAEGGVRMELSTVPTGVEPNFSASAKHENGRFSFARLLPGAYWIGPVPVRRGGRYWSPLPWATVEITGGETAHVRLTGGRGVEARLEMPEEAWAWYRKASPYLQAKIVEAPDALRAFYRSIHLRAESDGRVWTAALPPGKYVIRDNYISDPGLSHDRQELRFIVETTRFTIDNDPANEGVPRDLGVIQVLEKPPHDAPQRQVGDEAPDFTVPLLDDASFRLDAMRGKVVLLYFWAAWHTACHREVPSLAEVWKRHGGRDDFAMLGMNLDYRSEDMQAFFKEHAISWPQAYLDGWYGHRVPIQYVVMARNLPQIFIVGRDGKIAAANVRGAQMLQAIGAALGQ